MKLQNNGVISNQKLYISLSLNKEGHVCEIELVYDNNNSFSNQRFLL